MTFWIFPLLQVVLSFRIDTLDDIGSGKFQIQFDSGSPLASEILRNDDIFLYSNSKRLSASDNSLSLVQTKV